MKTQKLKQNKGTHEMLFNLQLCRAQISKFIVENNIKPYEILLVMFGYIKGDPNLSRNKSFKFLSLFSPFPVYVVVQMTLLDGSPSFCLSCFSNRQIWDQSVYL